MTSRKTSTLRPGSEACAPSHRPPLDSSSMFRYRDTIPDVIAHSVSEGLLMHALIRRDADAVRAHLREGRQVDRTAPSGASMLMLSIPLMEPDIVRLLLDKGADPCLRDRQGRDAMDHLEQLESSLSSTLRLNEGSMILLSKSLQKASSLPEGPCQEILKRLSDLGPECRRIRESLSRIKEMRSLIEWSLDQALFHAARAGDLGKAKAAVDAGADPISLDGEDRSAYAIAKALGHTDLAAYLKEELDEALLGIITEEGYDPSEAVRAIMAGAELPGRD